MPVLRHIRHPADMQVVHWNQEVYSKLALWNLTGSHSWCNAPEISVYLVVLNHSSCLIYINIRIDYCWRGCTFECRLGTHHRHLLLVLHKVEPLVIFHMSRSEH